MKKQNNMIKKLIIIGLIFCVSCKENKKETPVIKNETIDTVPGTKQDTVTPNNPTRPPSGKIDIETFGTIKIGQHYAETIKALGNPDSKSKAIEWEADGLMHEDWTWKAKGLVLGMSSEHTNPEGSLAIFSITAKAPCDFKTRANIGIGNSYAEVNEAYKRDIDASVTDKTQIVVGSVYGGISFSFKNDKVEKIFLGAMAE